MDLEILKSKIRAVEDWPKEGIVFRDITPVLEDKKAFCFAIDELASLIGVGERVDKIVGIDARGFIFASAVAYKLKTGLAIVRKKGKLPPKTIAKNYDLEYASETLEMKEDSIKAEERVVIVDDVLATGGTMTATCELIEKLGGEITDILFFIELGNLGGKEKLSKYKVKSLIKF